MTAAPAAAPKAPQLHITDGENTEEPAWRGRDGTGSIRMGKRINEDSSRPEIIKGLRDIGKGPFCGGKGATVGSKLCS